MHPQTQTKAEACMHQNTHRQQPSRLYLYKQRFCWSRAADLLFSVCAFVFFSVVLNSCLAPVDFSFSATLSITLTLQPLSSPFSASLGLLPLSHCLFVVLSLLQCLITRQAKQSMFSLLFLLLCLSSTYLPFPQLTPTSLSLFLCLSAVSPPCRLLLLTSFSPSSPLTVYHRQELPKLLHPCSIRRRRRRMGGVSRRRARVGTDVGI